VGGVLVNRRDTIGYDASSGERIVRPNVTSTTSNDTAPAVSSIWDTNGFLEGQDTGKPRTYSRFRKVL